MTREFPIERTGEECFAIAVSMYNESITSKLLEGALLTLAKHGYRDHQVHVARVPGAWELPLVVDRLARSGDYAGVIALGAVIKGETTHDEHINRAVSLTLAQIALAASTPVAFGLLTCNSLEQAIHRSGGNVGNKGEECAAALLHMAGLLRGLPSARS